jgi:hypothetical protein
MLLREVKKLKFSSTIPWSQIFAEQKPVLIEGLANDWPAIVDPTRRWSDLSSFRNRVDPARGITVEIGESYMDPNLQQGRAVLKDFLEFISKPKDALDGLPRVFLAQYELNQIPEMEEDVKCPEICQTGKGHLYRTNIWFGSPLGTISPCHIDPFNNILIQIVGKKKVEVIDPCYSPHLYPAYGTVQKNTSRVDFEKPDLKEFPKFAEAERHMAELNPGDGLFIPFKWWHYCKTEDLSCSVNFWWL